jgi:cellobiose phosphorylase
MRPEHDGLRIDPYLPSDWDGYRATRRFRGASYDIIVHKPEGRLGRANALVVDGRRVDGTIVARPRLRAR